MLFTSDSYLSCIRSGRKVLFKSNIKHSTSIEVEVLLNKWANGIAIRTVKDLDCNITSQIPLCFYNNIIDTFLEEIDGEEKDLHRLLVIDTVIKEATQHKGSKNIEIYQNTHILHNTNSNKHLLVQILLSSISQKYPWPAKHVSHTIHLYKNAYKLMINHPVRISQYHRVSLIKTRIKITAANDKYVSSVLLFNAFTSDHKFMFAVPKLRSNRQPFLQYAWVVPPSGQAIIENDFTGNTEPMLHMSDYFKKALPKELYTALMKLYKHKVCKVVSSIDYIQYWKIFVTSIIGFYNIWIVDLVISMEKAIHKKISNEDLCHFVRNVSKRLGINDVDIEEEVDDTSDITEVSAFVTLVVQLG